MNLRAPAIALFLLLGTWSVAAQTLSTPGLPLPKVFQAAVAAGTRTLSGVPGKTYWQNRADYIIRTKLIPEQRLVAAVEHIRYRNTSPNELAEIVFHLDQDLYRKGNARDVAVAPDDVTNGVKIESISVETPGHAVEKIERAGTCMTVTLNHPLAPGEDIGFLVEWKVLIPAHTDLRMGMKEDGVFVIGQWYPRVAVYDDLYGWDTLNHTGAQEFYHDAGSFDVSIEVPDGYVVWATGTLQNPDEVLPEPQLLRYRRASSSDEVVQIVTSPDLETGKPLTQRAVWHFRAAPASDFVFAASNHFLWDATSVEVGGNQPSRVLVQAAYPEDAKDFPEVAKLARRTVESLSTELPGVPFPFPAVTVFNGTNGTSGMEYPMLVNNPSAPKHGRTVDVTAHEITHSYFPFLVLTNETRWGWMDEAFAAMLPYRYQERTDPSLNRLTRYAESLSSAAVTEYNLPVMTPSDLLTGRTYYLTAYSKPALALYYLEELLGKDRFRAAIQGYIQTWSWKHPSPWDFFFSIENTTGQALGWFFRPWFFTSAAPDLALGRVELDDPSLARVVVLRKGKLPVPVRLTVTFENGSTTLIRRSVDAWRDGARELVIALTGPTKVKTIRLGDGFIPDADPSDNVYPPPSAGGAS